MNMLTRINKAYRAFRGFDSAGGSGRWPRFGKPVGTEQPKPASAQRAHSAFQLSGAQLARPGRRWSRLG